MFRIKKVYLKEFKRFHDLTLDLGDNPKKIIALVGPNGCGKSSIFDGFEFLALPIKGTHRAVPNNSFYEKNPYSEDIKESFERNKNIRITWNQEPFQISKTTFCIRSAYRHTSTLDIKTLGQQTDITLDSLRPVSTADTDARLSDNYQRLISEFIEEAPDSEKIARDLYKEKFSKINEILSDTLGIEISDSGNPLKPGRGKLFFKKGKSINFPFDNLSAGEKEVIDLVMDLIVKSKDYTDTVFCIDEPELHLNTKIQRQLLVEIDKLIPETCQLWIATHSVGFLRALQEDLKDKSQILDFSEKDFDKTVVIEPMKSSRNNWQRIFKTALEDISELVSPKQIIYCEGRKEPTKNGDEQGLDANVYNEIFGQEFTDTVFVSSGGNTEPENNMSIGIMVLSKVLNQVKFIRLSDRDEKNEEERSQWLQEEENRKMLDRREIENYLFDKEIIKKAFPGVEETEYDKIVTDIVKDDVKSKSSSLMALCAFNNHKKFCLHLATYVTSETKVYDELKACIWTI